MSADIAAVPAPLRPAGTAGTAAGRHGILIAESFKAYNDEFREITRRAARNFLQEAWTQGQHDAVERIELYEKCVSRCVAEMGERLGQQRTDAALWGEIKLEYESLVARRPDS